MLTGYGQDRFGIPEIGEFYASTEGMLTLINHSRLPSSSPLAQGIGAIGHHGLLLRHKNKNNYACVEIDAETNEIIRDGKTGFAKRKAFEEGGEVLVRMEGEGSWAGYWRDGRSTGKKVVKDVFERGDCWFRSGDRLRRDREGFWWFLDRLGEFVFTAPFSFATVQLFHFLFFSMKSFPAKFLPFSLFWEFVGKQLCLRERERDWHISSC